MKREEKEEDEKETERETDSKVPRVEIRKLDFDSDLISDELRRNSNEDGKSEINTRVLSSRTTGSD